jgi:uncharacterized membrane protein
MSRIRRSILVDASLKDAFDYSSDPRNLPECWPSIQEVKNVDGQRSFDFVYKMVGVRLGGHSEILEIERNSRIKIRTSRGIQSLLLYTFQVEEDMTKVTLDIEYTIPNQVLAGLCEPIVRRVNEREAALVLESLKDRLRA